MNMMIAPLGEQTMSSREIAKLTGSSHDNVLKAIRRLIGEGVVFGNEAPYIHPQNGQTYREFQLDFRNTMVVVSGYSAELRARIIDRWQELETAQRVDPMQALNDPATMRNLLLTYSEKMIALETEKTELEEANARLAPKAGALDRIARADGSLCITDAAKVLQIRPKELFDYLQANQWIYRRHGTGWLGYSARTASGLLEHKVTTVQRADGSERVSEQVRITPKGIAKLAEIFGQGGDDERGEAA